MLKFSWKILFLLVLVIALGWNIKTSIENGTNSTWNYSESVPSKIASEVQPEVIEPKLTEQNQEGQPKVTEPKVTEKSQELVPEVIQPKVIEPEVIQPEVIQPKIPAGDEGEGILKKWKRPKGWIHITCLGQSKFRVHVDGPFQMTTGQKVFEYEEMEIGANFVQFEIRAYGFRVEKPLFGEEVQIRKGHREKMFRLLIPDGWIFKLKKSEIE